MHLIIFCCLKTVWNALSVYLHHLCLIFLAGTDFAFQLPSLKRSRGDTSFTTPRRGSSMTRRSTWYIHQCRRRPSPPGVKGLPLDGGLDLPLPRGRIRGLQCTHRRAHTTHGHTSTTLEQEAPRDHSRRAQLRPKA